MKKFLVLFVMVLFVSSPAFAWDDLLMLAPPTVIGDPGDAMVGVGLRYSTAGDMYDADSEKQELADDMTGIRVPIVGKYNVIENLQAFAIVPIVSMDDGTDSESGIGDVWLGAQYAIMPDGLLNIRGALDIPAGDDEKGLGNPGGFGIDVGAVARKPINEMLGVKGQLGIRWNGEDSDTKWTPGMGIYAQGGVTYQVTEQIPAWLELTYFGQGDGEWDGNEVKDSAENWLELNVGGGYKISDTLGCMGAIQYTLTGTNTNAELGIFVGLGYNISM